MKKAAINSNTAKSKSLVVLEYILLAVCLSVIALRTTLTESPTAQSPTLPTHVGDIIYSLSVSGVLIFSLALWLIWNGCCKKFSYRVTGMEIGLALFCVAAIISGFAAADKRRAINDVAILTAPIVMAVLLAQILDSWPKIMLVLCVVGALGVVLAYEGTYQLLVTNQATIEQYEQDPQELLAPLGIEPGSFKHFLFEDRLYSQRVRGFFTTRNSAGSFALMASFAAVAVCLQAFKSRKSRQFRGTYLLACASATTIVLYALVLTRSKGGIIGALFGGALFAMSLRWGNWLRKYRKLVLTICILLILLVIVAIAFYGLSHGWLPGGNPMLVRWQYWHASAKMFADHPVAGVGPGNFSQYYPRYKPAAALESVSDPHNFPLSILTQYGLLGLAGFLVMIFLPLWKVTSRNSKDAPAKAHPKQVSLRTVGVAMLMVISVSLLVLRPVLMPSAIVDTFNAMLYVVFTMYVAPVAVLVLGFLLLLTPLEQGRLGRSRVQARRIVAILFCAILGVILQNQIDYAIFEPGVAATFWALIACMVAAHANVTAGQPRTLKPTTGKRVLVLAAASVAIAAYVYYAWLPVYESTEKIQRAHHAVAQGQFDWAHTLLDEAAAQDRLTCEPAALNGQLYVHHYKVTQSKNRDLLLSAQKCFLQAIERNKATFKNYERLAEVYALLAETAPAQQKTALLNTALHTFQKAVQRYPGCGRLRFKLAETAEKLDKREFAVEQYAKAVEIEDSYRDQFRRMFPERDQIVSRLGQEMYKRAKQRIEALSEK